MTVPGWPPKDWRAMLALVASVVGSAVLTAFAAWIVWILWRGGWGRGTELARIEALAKAMLITLGTIAAVLLSLGLAINRRSIKLGRDGFEASGGETETVTAVTTTTTVETPPAKESRHDPDIDRDRHPHRHP